VQPTPCRARHGDPDVNEQEIYRPIDLFQRFAQIAFAQIDEVAQASLLEMPLAAEALCGSNSVPMTTPSPPWARALSRMAAAR